MQHGIDHGEDGADVPGQSEGQMVRKVGRLEFQGIHGISEVQATASGCCRVGEHDKDGVAPGVAVVDLGVIVGEDVSARAEQQLREGEQLPVS
jgi:hypothetical protein